MSAALQAGVIREEGEQATMTEEDFKMRVEAEVSLFGNVEGPRRRRRRWTMTCLASAKAAGVDLTSHRCGAPAQQHQPRQCREGIFPASVTSSFRSHPPGPIEGRDS